MSVYEADILEWSEHQAALLRRAAAGEGVDGLDWPNIIAEVEAVGRSELRAVQSHLIQALLHDLKCEAWPLAAHAPHWRAEARGRRGDARRAFVPSMRQKIDVADLYRDALRRMPETLDELPPMQVPAVCPVTLDELLSEA